MTKTELYDLVNTCLAENAKLEIRLHQWMLVAERRGIAVDKTRNRVTQMIQPLNQVVLGLMSINEELGRVLDQEQNTGS